MHIVVAPQHTVAGAWLFEHSIHFINLPDLQLLNDTAVKMCICILGTTLNH